MTRGAQPTRARAPYISTAKKTDWDSDRRPAVPPHGPASESRPPAIQVRLLLPTYGHVRTLPSDRQR